MRFDLSQLKVWLLQTCACKRQAESASKYKLVERFSHELRTSLTGIVGYSEFVEETSTEPMVNFTAKIIRESGHTLARTSSSFFELYRLTEGQVELRPSSFSISRLVNEVVKGHQKYASDHSVHLFFTCSEETYLSEMMSDERYVKQVVDLLVFSAVQQAEKEQSVHVDVSVDEGLNRVKFLIKTSVVVLNQVQINLYEEFWGDFEYSFRLQEGPGVDLALARALIDLLDGDVKYSSSDSNQLIETMVRLPLRQL